MIPAVAILTIGDELLQGDRADTNARWLAAALTKVGFRVVRIASCGDDERAIQELLSELEAAVGPGVIVATGGLGPTLDDRTREAVSTYRGQPLEDHPEVLRGLEEAFRRRGEPDLPPTNRRIARAPRGARVHANPVGTAPALEVAPAPGFPAVIFLLPGVPFEMRALATEALFPRLETLFPGRPGPDAVRVIRTSGIAESRLAAAMEPILDRHPGVNLQLRPSVRGVELRFSAPGPGGTGKLAAALEALSPVLTPWAWGDEEASLEGEVLRAFEARGWTLGVAESCTGGRMGGRITGVPGSSRVFLGGVMAYDNAVKASLLGVDGDLLRRVGAVSEPVAQAMATGVIQAVGSRVGVGITGVAGPAGGSPSRPVGTVWIGWAPPGGPPTARRFQFPGGRDEIQERAVQEALLGLLWMARGRPLPPSPAFPPPATARSGEAGSGQDEQTS